MCTHDPACPAADAIDWWAARNIAEHPDQGWTLLCNGAFVFDDHGALLPDGRVAAIPDTQLQQVFHELHAAGRHALCGVCGSQYQPPAGTEVTTSLRWAA
jgi:hypothetical protein